MEKKRGNKKEEKEAMREESNRGKRRGEGVHDIW